MAAIMPVKKDGSVSFDFEPSYPPSLSSTTDAQQDVAAGASSTMPASDVLPAAILVSPQAPLSPQQLGGWRLVAVELCLMLGLLLSVMETSIVATALITIAKDFNDFIRVTWVVLAYLLTYLGFSVIITRTSDVVGRKWTLVGSLVVFSGFSLACGLAQSMTQLIAFRALQGIGGAGLFGMCFVTVPEITPQKNFAAMSGVIGGTFATSSIIGPLLGGVITKSNWRWIFLLNVPCGVMIIAAVLICWPDTGRNAYSRSVKLGQVDYFGAGLLLAASVLLVFALQEGGATAFAWSSPTIISTLVVAACCWIALAGWIWLLYLRRDRWTLQAILPATIFKKRVLVVVLISTFMTGYCFLSLLIQLPMRFQIVNRETPVMAGVHLLPLLAASALGSFLGGAASSRGKNNTFYTLLAASCLILLGSGLLSTLADDPKVPHAQYGYQVIFGLGTGLTFSTVTVMTAVWADFADVAVAQGATSQARIFGGSVGLAIGTIILNRRINADLAGVLSPVQLANLRQSLSTIQQLAPMQQGAVVKVFAASFNSQLRVCTYVAVVAVLASLCAYSKHPPDMGSRQKAREEWVRKEKETVGREANDIEQAEANGEKEREEV